jgi:hypothetical protein
LQVPEFFLQHFEFRQDRDLLGVQGRCTEKYDEQQVKGFQVYLQGAAQAAVKSVT